MTTKGSPKVTAQVDLIQFALQSPRAIQFPPLKPQQYFKILAAVVQREKLQFRQLFTMTMQELLDGKGWGDIAWLKVNGSLPTLPPGLTLQTKCQPSDIIALSVDESGMGKLAKYIIMTRNGGLFFFEHDNASPGRIVPLTQEVFLREFMETEGLRAVEETLKSLRRIFYKTHQTLKGRADTFGGEEYWLGMVMSTISNLSIGR